MTCCWTEVSLGTLQKLYRALHRHINYWHPLEDIMHEYFSFKWKEWFHVSTDQQWSDNPSKYMCIDMPLCRCIPATKLHKETK